MARPHGIRQALGMLAMFRAGVPCWTPHSSQATVCLHDLVRQAAVLESHVCKAATEQAFD